VELSGAPARRGKLLFLGASTNEGVESEVLAVHTQWIFRIAHTQVHQSHSIPLTSTQRTKPLSDWYVSVDQYTS
jgi:hypothetical protein